jgi:hypothetical protein
MDMKTLRRRCAARIRDLPIPNPFDIEIFVASVAERRGRPIVLQPISLHGVVSGAWAAMESIDIVFYEQHATPFHQQHIALHELSHILCEHRGFAITEEGLRSLLLADVPIERLRTLQSHHYSDEDEQEAEMLPRSSSSASTTHRPIPRSAIRTSRAHCNPSTTWKV